VEYRDEASNQAKAIGARIHQVELGKFKGPWNVHYASHEPERKFSALLFEIVGAVARSAVLSPCSIAE
jgi:hypothetical protein